MFRRLLALVVALAVAMAMAAPAPASAAPNGPPDGFILQDTSGAYVEFEDDGCNVFVGYVSTDRLKFFGVPGGFQPHSDLEVTLTGTCSATGVVNTLNHSQAEFVELESAFVDGIAVTLDDGSVATVNLTWTAKGEIIRWSDHAPGMIARHQTKLADIGVTGSVVISGSISLTVDPSHVVFGEGELDAPRITFYDEIQLRP
jgi:hypothetical protein